MSSKRYVTVFLITFCIFIFTFWLSNQFSSSKIKELRDLESQIGLNILSTETRYSLLEKTSCEHVITDGGSDIGLNSELTDLAHRVKFMESQLGSTNDQVVSIKKYYTLLQIKDYLLTKEFQTRCNQNIASILYFHQSDCSDCMKQSIVLDEISNTYPKIRVYWLDKDISTPALQTMLSIFNITKGPTIVIKDKSYTGFQSLADIEKHMPEIAKWNKEKAAQDAKDKTPATKTTTPTSSTQTPSVDTKATQ